MNYRLLLLPVLGLVIGWGTNALAVKMLFHPRKPLNIFGLKFQGLLPKRQNQLAEHLGRTVQTHLISHEDIHALFRREDVQEQTTALIAEKINFFIDERLTSLNPMIGMFLQGEIRDKLARMMLDEMAPLVPAFAESMMDKAEEHLDFQAIVEEKVRQFDLDRLESMVWEIAARELRHIEWIGGILGFLIGVIQLLVVLWLG